MRVQHSAFEIVDYVFDRGEGRPNILRNDRHRAVRLACSHQQRLNLAKHDDQEANLLLDPLIRRRLNDPNLPLSGRQTRRSENTSIRGSLKLGKS